MILVSFWILLVVTIFLFLPFTAKILMRPPRHFGRRPLEGGPKMVQHGSEVSTGTPTGGCFIAYTQKARKRYQKV